jgi:hypothetical protein
MNLPAIIASENSIPIPIARYNILSYNSTNNSNLPQTFGGSTWPNATLRRGNLNTLTTAAPRFITISALPPAYPSQTGGIHIGTSNTFRSVEMWIRLQRLSNAGKYLFDFRGGLANGFSIGGNPASSTAGNNGAGIVGTTYYSNTNVGTWTATTNPTFLLSNAGWVQFVQTFSNNVTDTATLFCRHDHPTTDAFVQGMPVQVGDVAFYTETLTARQVKSLFNAKCSRYSLSPRP